jgi:hypothetical protein
MAVTYFGNNSNGDITGALLANYKYCSRFTNGTAGNITELGINFPTGGTGHVRIGVYNITAEAGHPGTMVLDAGVITNPVSGWNSITGLLTAVTAIDYYLVALSDFQVDFYGVAAQFNYYNSQAYGALSDPFGDIAGGQSNGLCMRAGVEPPPVTTNLLLNVV